MKCIQKKSAKRNIIQFDTNGRQGLSESGKESYSHIRLQSTFMTKVQSVVANQEVLHGF